MLDDGMLSQGWGGPLQLTTEHLSWVAPLLTLLHLSPHFFSQRWLTPGNMLVLRTPVLQQLIGSAGGMVGGGRSPVVAVVQARCVVAGQGSGRGSRRGMGLVQLPQLLPHTMGMGRGRRRGSLELLPLEALEHGWGQVQLLPASGLHRPIIVIFTRMVQSTHVIGRKVGEELVLIGAW